MLGSVKIVFFCLFFQAVLFKKNRELWVYLKMITFPLPLLETKRFFSDYHSWKRGRASGGKTQETVGTFQRLSPLTGFPFKLVYTESPAIRHLLFKVFLLILAPSEGLSSWAFASCTLLFSVSTCLSSFQGGGLLSGFNSLTDLRRVVDFLFFFSAFLLL